MKHLLLAAALALSACAPPPDSPPAPAVVATVVLEGTRAFLVAEYAYEAAATTALSLTRAGLIKGEPAARLRAINARATAALIAGKAARDTAARAAQAEILFSLVEQINAIIPMGGAA